MSDYQVNGAVTTDDETERVSRPTVGADVEPETESIPLKISPDEHEPFNGIANMKFMSSTEYCETVSGIFRQVFADFEGSAMDVVPNTNNVTLSLFFNHRDYSDPRNNPNGLPVACSKDYVDDKTKNNTLRTLRERQNLLNNGDRYFLTEDGKSVISDLLVPGAYLFNQNGEVKWNKCVAEVADPNAQYMYGNNTRMQYTKVSYIDVVKMTSLIYGDNDGDDEKYVYNLSVLRSIPQLFGGQVNQGSGEYVLRIDRISEKVTEELARKYGFSFTSGLNIIR